MKLPIVQSAVMRKKGGAVPETRMAYISRVVRERREEKVTPGGRRRGQSPEPVHRKAQRGRRRQRGARC